MRDYKFRGKRVDGKGWVYGYLVAIENSDGLETFAIKDTLYHVNNGRINIIPVEVIPETVGQFIDLKDNCGKDIYNGDVMTSNKNAFFLIEFINGGERLKQIGFNYLYTPRCTNPEDIKEFEITIIGNIYDNPELLIPPADSPAQHTMYDPNIKQDQESAQAETTADGQTTGQATESAEEGNTEG